MALCIESVRNGFVYQLLQPLQNAKGGLYSGCMEQLPLHLRLYCRLVQSLGIVGGTACNSSRLIWSCTRRSDAVYKVAL